MPLDIESIQNLRPGTQIHYFSTLDSTMTEAARLAALGARHGTVVLADEQTAGIGRMGRSWHSPPEAGIYCSVLLGLPLGPSELPIASLLLGLATAEAIQTSTALACDLKWPNDVLIRERKVAGILTQLHESCIVAGMGINVNHESFPTGLRTPATSLRIEDHGRIQSRETILINLLESIDALCSMLEADGTECVLRAFTSASSYAVNRRIVIEETGARFVTAGLDQNGFLLVRSDSGNLERVVAGSVRADW